MCIVVKGVKPYICLILCLRPRVFAVGWSLMPRQIRIEYPGAIYHVLSRGDRRGAIFRDDGDCHDFIKTLAEACQKTGFQIHAFCPVSYTHLRAHETGRNLVCRLLLEKKK